MEGGRPTRLTPDDTAVAGGRLRNAGLRATRPRQTVLALLDGWAGHHAVDDLSAALVDLGHRFPRQSVYNVLDDLVRVGLALPADTGPGRALYERAGDWHHHFVCLDCGAVMDVPCAIGDKPCLDAAVPGAEIDEAQVIFRGRCADCAGRGPADA